MFSDKLSETFFLFKDYPFLKSAHMFVYDEILVVVLLHIHANVKDARTYVGSDGYSLETDVSISIRKRRINEHLVATNLDIQDETSQQFAAKDLQIFDQILV